MEGPSRACGNCGQLPEEGHQFSHCARCRQVAYCSGVCQRNHWRAGGHKKACVPLAQQAQEPAKDDDLSKPMNKPPHKPSSGPDNNSSAGGAAAATEEQQDEKLPRRAVARVDAEGKELSFGEHDDCTICLDALRHPIKLPCGHWFCKECIEGLRQARSVQDLCPTCREPLPPGADQLFAKAWQIWRQVERKVERREQGWANLPANLQREMDKVRDLYEQAAEQGHAMAQYNLGVMYANGQGVAQNYTTAVKFYEQAAEQGYAMAQYNLGVMYGQGHGVAQNYTTAAQLYERAAEQGH